MLARLKPGRRRLRGTFLVGLAASILLFGVVLLVFGACFPRLR